MVAIARYRRFILLVVLCCISFFVFGWYTKVQESGNEPVLLTPVQLLPDDVEVIETVETNHKEPEKSREPSPVSFKKNNPFSKLIEEEQAINKLGSNDGRFEPSRSEFDLFSGPTEEAFTFPYKKMTDSDLEYSGPPAEFHFERVTKPSMRYQELEMMNSGPTDEDDFFAATVPSKLNSEIEMENSGPTEYSARRKPTKSLRKSLGGKLSSLKSKIYSKLYKSSENIEPSTTPVYAVTKPEKSPGLILDTPACKIPKLDPWDPTVIGLYEKQDLYECPGPPLFLKSNPDGSITINETILLTHYNVTSMDNVSCFYEPIVRKHEEPGNVRENDYTTKNISTLKSGIPLHEDYVAVQCNLDETRNFEQYFPLVRLRPEIEEQRSSIPPPEPRLNVILAGIDSISKLNFLRHFPRTHAFLKEKLSPFEMNGYTKVGDNTFPNLVPLLTGHFVEYYWNESLRDTMYFDHLDLIWKDYAKKGYRTFYAEDSPYTGTFNYIKRGFYDPPTDYYLRPLALALESSRVKEKSKQHCYNSQLETDLIYDFLRDFIAAMGPRPYIAFAMVSTMTHDYLNKAGYADEPAVRLLEHLHDSGALNNSMLVLFGDHGLRFGPIRQTYIGKFEERMPFMYINFPKWFLDRYPDLHKNLRDNQDRLMTLFDIHATMLDLLNVDHELPPEEKSSLTRGSSLLREISPNRTCEDANILAHWCPCQTFEEVDLNDNVTVSCAQAVVDDINSRLSPYEKCAVLEIDTISDARLGQANDLVMRFVRHDNVVVNRTVVLGDKVKPLGDYLITMTTKPGGAVFEATVRYDSENESYTVMGISRINMYGNQSRCVDRQQLKIYCYCLAD